MHMIQELFGYDNIIDCQRNENSRLKNKNHAHEIIA